MRTVKMLTRFGIVNSKRVTLLAEKGEVVEVLEATKDQFKVIDLAHKGSSFIVNKDMVKEQDE